MVALHWCLSEAAPESKEPAPAQASELRRTESKSELVPALEWEPVPGSREPVAGLASEPVPAPVSQEPSRHSPAAPSLKEPEPERVLA
jgi:hypothetical protein